MCIWRTVFLAMIVGPDWCANLFAAELGPRFKPQIDAEEIIEKCWAISLDERSSGATSTMAEGNFKTALCLENAVVENASALYENSESMKKDFKRDMKELRIIYGSFYYVLMNENRACPTHCGTQYQVIFVTQLATFFEGILKDVIKLRNRYHW